MRASTRNPVRADRRRLARLGVHHQARGYRDTDTTRGVRDQCERRIRLHPSSDDAISVIIDPDVIAGRPHHARRTRRTPSSGARHCRNCRRWNPRDARTPGLIPRSGGHSDRTHRRPRSRSHVHDVQRARRAGIRVRRPRRQPSTSSEEVAARTRRFTYRRADRTVTRRRHAQGGRHRDMRSTDFPRDSSTVTSAPASNWDSHRRMTAVTIISRCSGNTSWPRT
jgi:hypothetical protein